MDAGAVDGVPLGLIKYRMGVFGEPITLTPALSHQGRGDLLTLQRYQVRGDGNFCENPLISSHFRSFE